MLSNSTSHISPRFSSSVSTTESSAPTAGSFSQEGKEDPIFEEDLNEFWDFADLISRKEFGLEIEVRTAPRIK